MLLDQFSPLAADGNTPALTFAALKGGAPIALDDHAYLRALTVEDVGDSYVNGMNDPEVHRFMTSVRQNRQTWQSVADYVAANMESEADILFGIFVHNQLRGTVRLHAIEWARGSAHVGISLFDKSIWNQGWGRRALAVLSDVAIGALGLMRLMAGIYRNNTSSRRTFLAAGFVHEPASDSSDSYDVCEIYVLTANNSAVLTTGRNEIV